MLNQSAARFVSDFGIATECGLGRRSVETIVPLLELHAKIADAGAQALSIKERDNRHDSQN